MGYLSRSVLQSVLLLITLSLIAADKNGDDASKKPIAEKAEKTVQNDDIIRRWISKLGSDEFQVREQATVSLT